MALTVQETNRARTDGKPLKLFDDNGLYVYVTKSVKSLRSDYQRNGKRGTIVLGKHPALSLAKAREMNREIRQLVAQGIDPAIKKWLDKLEREASFGDTFEATAKHWYDRPQETWPTTEP